MTTHPRIDKIVAKWTFLNSWFKNWHMPKMKHRKCIIQDNNAHHESHGRTYGLTYRLPDVDYMHHYRLAMPRRRMGQV